MAASTTSTEKVERSRDEILASLAEADEAYRAFLNTCRDIDAHTVRQYQPDGSYRRICVTNPLDLRKSGLTGASAGRRPIPTQRCTSSKPAKSAQIGQGGQ